MNIPKMKSSSHLSRRGFLRQAGCAGMSALPLLNTLLNLRLMEGVATASAPAAGEYRALVCILLAGGNDSFNMLVPREATAYASYQSSRSNLALTPAQLIDIHPTGQPDFGVHGAMPELANLFETGQAAFVANVGSLIEPVQNRTQVNQNLKRLPLGLYSHSDQIEQWQTSIPHSRSGIGWGGNQFVVGGAVAGKKIYGAYPALTLNPDSGPEVNPLDTGRGRFIPTTSCDQFFAELALWLGVSKSDLPTIFPNIGNFYSPSSSAPPLGFMA